MNLTVTRSVNVKINDTVSSLTSGSQYSFIVNRLQTVYIGSSSDLTGTRIMTDKPVSVFSGHECGVVPSSSYYYCDHLIEQVPPTTYWGKTYYIAPLQGRSAYTIRVLAAHNSTEVFMDCNGAGNSYTINAGNSFTVTYQIYCAIHSNKEILVAQYSPGSSYDGKTGDPMMMLVPATDHYSNEINLSTISSGYSDYINIIVLKEYYQPSMMYWIRGGVKRSLLSQSWNTITFNQVTEAYYTQLSVSNGPVTIIHTTANALMSAVVYGFAYREAYGHSGGFSIQNFRGKNITTPICIIIPLNPSFLPADSGINNGTSNVMINCKCFNIDYQQIRWYSPNEEEVPFNYTETEDLPYVINGTLIIPIFSDSYQGTYYCGVGNDSVFGANISLTLWTGNNYYIGFFQNNNGGSISLYLTNTGSLDLSYNIEAPGVGYYTGGTISGTGSTIVSLSSSLITGSYNDQNKGIYFKTNSTNVVVIGQNDVYLSSDTFLALPTIKVCCTQYTYYGISVSSGRYDNVVLIVGTEDNTMMNLIVTQSVNVKINDTVSSLTSGSPYSFIVNRLQTVYIGSSSDLTGTRIMTDKPVSVFSGHECGYVLSFSSSYCDHLIEQIPPTTYWGKTYYIAPLQARSAYTIRVLAAYNSTEVLMDCKIEKNFYTIDAGNSFTVTHQYYCAIHSNKEILVAQYSPGYGYDGRTGDPMMMLVPATDHYSNEINLSTISSGYSDYINIIVLKEYYQPSMMYWIRGGVKRSLLSQSWNTITFNQVTEAYYTQLSVSNGPVTIIHTTANALMSAVVYGFVYRQAYGHPGGFSIQNFRG
ncbi:uncharacterized protein [Dysidea avara]|uniref:uncharacterized protein n=1 Tax=Dysidea avara TaxID=196820 RepID=UPI003327027B